MTTKLESPVTRETSLQVDGRPVNVTLVPADPARAAPVAIELHLKGTQRRKLIPLATIVDVVWPAPKPKKPKADNRPPELIRYGCDIDELERALAPWIEKD